MTLFRWRLTAAPEYWLIKLRLNIRKMGIVKVSLWYLAQRLKNQQLEDSGATISVRFTVHLAIHDGASRKPLPTGVSPPPDVRDALILESISTVALPSRRQSSTGIEEGIRVISGAPLDSPESLVQRYLMDALVTSENVCDH